MCFGGGGSPQTGIQYQTYQLPDGSTQVAEQGLPLSAVAQGIGTIAQWQDYSSRLLSTQQMQQQQVLAQQQNDFNQEQFNYQKQQVEQQKREADEQAARQTDYDTGRANLLAEGTKQVNDAFSQFTPEYFKGYADKYMTQAADDIAYQRKPAQKQMAFGLARRGTIDSQSGINQQGLLAEDEGRALAQQTQNATDAANQLKANTTNAKSSLLSQVVNAESIGSPIAGGNDASVQNSLNTQRNAVQGVATSAGDVISSLNAVPTVNPMLNTFGNVLSAAGSYLGGVQANAGLNSYRGAVAGTNPSGSTGSTANRPG